MYNTMIKFTTLSVAKLQFDMQNKYANYTHKDRVEAVPDKTEWQLHAQAFT
jgi:hypothetical protein